MYCEFIILKIQSRCFQIKLATGKHEKLIPLIQILLTDSWRTWVRRFCGDIYTYWIQRKKTTTDSSANLLWCDLWERFWDPDPRSGIWDRSVARTHKLSKSFSVMMTIFKYDTLQIKLYTVDSFVRSYAPIPTTSILCCRDQSVKL